MECSRLDVIAVIYNPIRWHSRQRLFTQFTEHMIESGVRLTIVECEHGMRPYKIPDSPHYNVVRVRTNSVCWIKENLINIGISRLPDDWAYVAWIDADIMFRHKYWASEAVESLQQYPVIQPWQSVIDLGPNGEVIERWKSFSYMAWHGKVTGIGQGYEFCHPGYAWCARRGAIDKVGGLIDFAILGAADHHMALGFIGKAAWSMPRGLHEDYVQAVLEWQRRAQQVTHGNLGYLAGGIEHYWHGSKENRKYIDRWQILIKNNYEPDLDIKKNTYGVIGLSGNKPKLSHNIDIYMRERREDLTWKTTNEL